MGDRWMDGFALDARNGTITSMLPTWMDPTKCYIAKETSGDDKRRISFPCSCNNNKVVRVDVRCKDSSAEAVGKALAAKCVEKHGKCPRAAPSKKTAPCGARSTAKTTATVQGQHSRFPGTVMP